MTRLVSILILSLFLTNCGGSGGGPVSISVPNPTNISISTDVVSNSFVSALIDIADDKQIDINEAYQAFQWVEQHPNFDPSSLANVNIIIDSQSMTLEQGYYALKGFKKRYYDGKESLWSMAVEQGQFDDQSAEYIAVQQIVEYDDSLSSQERLDLYKDQGQGQKVVVSTSISQTITNTDVVVGESVITTAITTRNVVESTLDGTVTKTYQTTTTTTKVPTHTTTTRATRTTFNWSDGTTTSTDSDPVSETVTTWSESADVEEVLTATSTVPVGEIFLTDEYNSTALDQIGASYAYARGWTGDGVIVGMIDSGIDTDHEDLDSDRFSTINYRFAGTEDDNGHGTHVAGIIAGAKNDIGTHGVAYDADLISIKLCSSSGRCSFSYFDDAMVVLSNQGAAVANLSANTSTTILTQIGSTDAYYLPGQTSVDGVADATLSNYQTAIDNGMIIVNSAGNYGMDYPMMPSHYATRVDSNGDLYLNGQWLIVGAVDSNNQIASWSNKAGHICSNVVYTDGVATGCDDTFNTKDFFVVAPGVNILSSANGGGTTTKSGTSMAAPYVTGSIAVLKQAWPQLRPEQLVGLITSTARDLGAPGVDAVYGHGLVDLNEATKPQGDIVAVQPSGAISAISGGIVGDSSMSGLDNISAVSSIVVMDSYNRDYYADDDNFTSFQLTEQALGNQYVNYEPVTKLQGDGMLFAMSENGDDWLYGKSVEHSDKLDVTYSFGRMKQDGSLLGSSFQGSFAIKSSTTNYVGADMNYSVTEKWTWNSGFIRGYSDVKSANDSYITGSSNIQSQSWYLGMTYQNINNQFIIKMGEQLNVVDGDINYTLPTAYNWTDNSTTFTSGSASAKSSEVPKVVELAYSKQLSESWNFSASSRYTFVEDNDLMTANLGVKYVW